MKFMQHFNLIFFRSHTDLFSIVAEKERVAKQLFQTDFGRILFEKLFRFSLFVFLPWPFVYDINIDHMNAKIKK